MIRNSSGDLEQKESEASAWSAERPLGITKGPFKPFFNRGFVMSQFMARFLKQRNLTLPQFKSLIKDEDDRTIRHFLSGDLRLALLKELETALKQGGQVFAALFELSDDELIEALGKLQGKANVVLANGSVQKEKGETATDARRRDENKEARKRLLKKASMYRSQERTGLFHLAHLAITSFWSAPTRKENPSVCGPAARIGRRQVCARRLTTES